MIALGLEVVGPRSQEREQSADELPRPSLRNLAGESARAMSLAGSVGWGAGRALALANHTQ
jgi:hypothetical protein